MAATRALEKASMKVPPKRKGNQHVKIGDNCAHCSLNESPSEKEGKLTRRGRNGVRQIGLNESPSEKEGKSVASR